MDDPPRARNRPPGYDEEDPYKGEDLERYPEWWRNNIREFEAHDMRPYRPPQFSDGEIVPELVKRLKDRHDVDILFRAVNSDIGDRWEIRVDDAAVAQVPRERRGDGYTEYRIDSEAFVSLVLNAESEAP